MARFLRLGAVLLGLLGVQAFAKPVSAQSIIRNPGDHPKFVELEPHLLLRPYTPDNSLGLGLGFRATIPIVENGFVPTINNSVGIGIGFDWMRYHACYYYDCGDVNQFSIPVVMQWNFWLTRSWSVFGEPGLSLNFYSSSDCYNGGYFSDQEGHRIFYRDHGGCYHDNVIDPVLFLGARWHFSPYTTLTMRVGWPYFSVGVSFL